MAITDVPEFAHLTDADIDNLAADLDEIRRDVEASLGEKDARYIRRTIAAWLKSPSLPNGTSRRRK